MIETDTPQRIDEAITKAQEIKALIDELREDPKASDLTNATTLSMLSTAAEYLTVNLSLVRRKIMHETGE